MKYPCLACKGSGRKGYIKGFVFPCPYCNGKKGYRTRKEQRDSGLRSGDIRRSHLQTNLFSKGGCIESTITDNIAVSDNRSKITCSGSTR